MTTNNLNINVADGGDAADKRRIVLSTHSLFAEENQVLRCGLQRVRKTVSRVLPNSGAKQFAKLRQERHDQIGL